VTRYFVLPALLIFLTFSGFASDEVRRFDIELAGIKIGELTATRKKIDTLVHYYIESKVSFWLFVKVNVHHIQTAVYHEDKLLHSTVKTRSNRGDFSSSVIWDKRHYVVKVDMYKYKHDGVIASSINFNVMRFFFDEPKNGTTVLADGYGLMAPVAFLKDSFYEVDVRGERNKYFFKEGKLQRAIMDSSIKNYEIILRKE